MSTTRLQEVQICFGFGKQTDIATTMANRTIPHGQSHRPFKCWIRGVIDTRHARGCGHPRARQLPLVSSQWLGPLTPYPAPVPRPLPA